MTDYVWKHLPYAIYLDTNALRSAGAHLDAPWINELLSITNEYGISVCISELVLSEWCEHIMGVLERNRQKLLSSITLLNHYTISVPVIKPDEISLPAKTQLVGIVSDMMKAAGFTVIPNWDAPLSAYSAQIGHQFRSIPATCSRVNRPPDRSEATLVFYYFSDLFFLVKEDRIFLMDSPFKFIL